MEALRAGALSVVEKPVAVTHDSYAALASRLCTQLAIMSEVKVLKQREEQQPQQPHPAPSDGRPAPLSAVLTRAVEAPPLGSYRLLAIAASTGGPSALMRLLSGLGPRFPLPIAVVQHMTPAFLGGFAEWLASVTPFPVTIVNAPTTLEPGHVYLAPSQDLHLAVHGSTAAPDNSPAEGVHRPSANVLFSSVARAFGSAALGVVLTGMGDDGTQGLLELRSAGAWVIAEHESTSAVYGMPAAAIEAGAVNETLPLPEIAPRILKVIGLQAKPA
jgi:two-component system chemotaxis response regulator CheB